MELRSVDICERHKAPPWFYLGSNRFFCIIAVLYSNVLTAEQADLSILIERKETQKRYSEEEVMSMWRTPRIPNSNTAPRQDRRWNPLMEFAPEMADLFRIPERLLGEEVDFVPSMDFQETDNEYVLTAEMPGIDPKNVEVSVRNGVLELKGEKKEEKESGQSGSSWTERRYGSFHRQITLDQEIKEDEVKATYKNGVLRIEVPKAESGSGGKSIPIETE
jgi:HSP20 family protein